MVKNTPQREDLRTGAGRKPLSRSLRMYQHIAVAFVAITFLLLLCVLYLSVSRATIRIVAEPAVVDVDAEVEVVAAPIADEQIKGVVVESNFVKSQQFILPSDGAKAVEGKAGGFVTLVNETNSPQPLVATTRLISQEGVLFRLENPATVPAKGQVEVLVKADQPGKGGEIPGSRFTIPGLNATLQQQIYGTSKATMTGGVQYVRVLSQADIDGAVTSLAAQIRTEAEQSLAANVDRTVLDGASLNQETITQVVDAAVGQEVGAFNVTLTQTVSAVYFSQADVRNFTERLLAQEVPEGFRVASVNRDTMSSTVDSVDVDAARATISVHLDGRAILSEEAQALNKDRFAGRAPHEVMTLLRASEAVQDVNVTFTPFWLKRVPTLQDHIRIIIEEPKQ